jgi:deazaflavin-dependent oxidoreductase (nitroreductase family)
LKTTNQSSSSKGNQLETAQFLYLTTRGHTSGKAREIEIWFTHRAGLLYVIAEYTTSNWIRNIRNHGCVQVRVADQSFGAMARVLETSRDRELIHAVQELSRQKYGWGEGAVVEILPECPRT